MSSLNKVTLIGNLGKDPEIRKTQDGRSIANFSLAMSESWKDKNTGEKKEKTEWINVVVFSEGLVGVVEKYVHKGSKIFIEGQLQTRKWQDKDGSDKYTTEVVLQNFKSNLLLLDGKNNAQPNDSGQYKPLPQAEGGVMHELDDDMPF